jgi:hypothetical protein
MAYSTSNPPVKHGSGLLTQFNASESASAGGSMWVYKSADLIATVEGANYFSNGQALGMQPGDLVYILDTTSPHAYLETVATVTANGASLSGVHVTTQ